MALTSTTTRARYAGNNSAVTPYAVPFLFFSNDHIRVTVVDADGVEVTLLPDAGYSISGAGDPNGGEIVTSAEWDNTHEIIIDRVVPATNPYAYQEGQKLPMARLTKNFDWLTMVVQQIAAAFTSGRRMLEFPLSEPNANQTVLPPPAERKAKTIAFNPDTGAMELQPAEDFFATPIAEMEATLQALADAASSSAGAAAGSEASVAADAASAADSKNWASIYANNAYASKEQALLYAQQAQEAAQVTASKTVTNTTARLALSNEEAIDYIVVEEDTGAAYMLRKESEWAPGGTSNPSNWLPVGGTVDNAAVNAAIAEDPSATRTSAQIGYLPVYYSTQIGGLNYVAKQEGPAGGNITITQVVSGTGSAVISVGVVGNAITVTAGSETTAATAATAINANGAASALVTATALGVGVDRFVALATTGLKAPLSKSGGPNNILQCDANGNLILGVPSGNMDSTSLNSGSPHNSVFVQDKAIIGWKKADGSLSAYMYHWQNHDTAGQGEWIFSSPGAFAFIGTQRVQFGNNDASRDTQSLQFVSGGASAGDTLRNSRGIKWRVNWWDGVAAQRKSMGCQAVVLDTSGKRVLRFWDNCLTYNEAGDGGILGTATQTGDFTGDLMCEMAEEGVWSPGIAPGFATLSDGTITQACSKYNVIQAAQVTLTQDSTLTITGAIAGMRGVIYVTQDSTGDWSLTPLGGSPLDLTTLTAGVTDKVEWEYDGIFYNYYVKKNIQREVLIGDPDAAAFIAAASISDPTQKSAISDLVDSLKAASLWSKFYALYPFVGGNYTAHSRDLKNAYNIISDGSAHGLAWQAATHNADGVTGNGTTAYGLTTMNWNTMGVLNSASMYAYVKSASVNNGGRLMGAFDLVTRTTLHSNGTAMLGDGINNADANSVVLNSNNGTARTHVYYNRSGASAQQFFAFNTTVSNAGVSTVAANANMAILGRGREGATAPDNRSTANLGFAAMGQSLSASEWATFMGIIDTFQTALLRANS